MPDKGLPSVFFEMLRSFVTMAECLNLSQAVRQLGSTRQTINRHIKELEQLKGGRLIVQVDRQFQLTEMGIQSHIAAKHVLSVSEVWATNEHAFADGLAHFVHDKDDDGFFYAQRHSLNKLWDMAPPLLKRGVEAWGAARAQLEHPASAPIRPYLVVYRRHRDEWLCVDVGEKSSFSTWLGPEQAKSSIGLNLSSDPINSKIDRFLIQAYQTVTLEGGHWYDHVSATISRGSTGKLEPVSYQRLVSSARFPDGSEAISVLIARTNQIKIVGLEPAAIAKTPEGLLMEFDI